MNKREYIKNLSRNMAFYVPDSDTVAIVDAVKSESGKTTITYRSPGEVNAYAFTRPSLATVEVI